MQQSALNNEEVKKIIAIEYYLAYLILLSDRDWLRIYQN